MLNRDSGSMRMKSYLMYDEMVSPAVKHALYNRHYCYVHEGNIMPISSTLFLLLFGLKFSILHHKVLAVCFIWLTFCNIKEFLYHSNSMFSDWILWERVFCISRSCFIYFGKFLIGLFWKIWVCSCHRAFSYDRSVVVNWKISQAILTR